MSGPSLSPDGRQVVVTSEGREAPNIWVYDIARGSRTRITFNPLGAFQATWTPSGEQITYSAFRGGFTEIFSASDDGSGDETQLTNGPLSEYDPHWSPDGETLTLGGDKLAVDGILLIGEHGDYPPNEKGQTPYPRFEAFLEITDVFRQTGHTVPVFSDKHLSYDWRKAQRMVALSRELGFPLMAGSSLPVTWRIPAVDVPYGATVKRAVGVAYGGLDSYGLHLLESIQCMVERRKGGETGVKSVQCFEDEKVWNFLDETPWAKRLFEHAVPHAVETYDPERPRSVVEHPAVFLVEYRDGLQTAGFMLTNYLRDFTVAVDVEGLSKPVSTLMYLEHTAYSGYHFVCQLKNIERMFYTGKATYPAERTMLVSGILDLALDSRLQGHKRLPTPMLDLQYHSPNESFYCTEGPSYLQNPSKLPVERVEQQG
jgi:hypothetical protein